MAETEPTLAKPTETSPHGRVSRWWVGGPLLVVALVVSGMLGWDAWKHHQFEKERTGTPPHVVEDLKLKLLWIPAGTFTMGTEEEAEWLKSLKKKYNELKPSGWGEWKEKEVFNWKTPLTVVRLSCGFYFGETEVAQAQWEALMGNNPSHFKEPNRPVEQVSWKDCVEYCRKLTERERAAGRIGPKQVFRLPTEAEWEYACRAGSRGEWSFGDDEKRLGEFAWYEGNSGGESHDVGSRRSNAWGLFDMHGNLWERCSDGIGDYPGGFVADPVGKRGGLGVRRGGSWMDSAMCCSSKIRDWCKSSGGKLLGFRLVLGQEP